MLCCGYVAEGGVVTASWMVVLAGIQAGNHDFCSTLTQRGRVSCSMCIVVLVNRESLRSWVRLIAPSWSECRIAKPWSKVETRLLQ